MVVKKGDKVKVEYEGTLNDGTVFDSWENHDELLQFVVGEGQVIKGFEDALVGMEIGDEKDLAARFDLLNTDGIIKLPLATET
jgi:FKBP-type peptidyl-prolyl cis-trans isomerase